MLTANQCSGSGSVGYWASLPDSDPSFCTDPDPSHQQAKKVKKNQFSTICDFFRLCIYEN